MSNFPKRNALLGGVAILSLLGSIYAPAVMAGEDNAEHNLHAAEASVARDKAAPAAQDKAVQMPQMDHGAMDHGSMNHEGMDHANMMDGHGGEAEAGSNHDR